MYASLLSLHGIRVFTFTLRLFLITLIGEFKKAFLLDFTKVITDRVSEYAYYIICKNIAKKAISLAWSNHTIEAIPILEGILVSIQNKNYAK